MTRSAQEKPKRTTQTENDAAGRLLRMLGEEGAFARIEQGRAKVFARRKGVTVLVGVGPEPAVRQLESDGALECSQGKRDGSWRLSAAGASRLKREQDGSTDRFANQHGAREPAAGAGGLPGALTNMQESPLLWLYRRSGKKSGKSTGHAAGFLGEAEFAAGERLRAEMTMARTLPRLSPDLERPSRSGVAMGLAPSEARMAAAQRVSAALRAVGPEFSGVLMDVCGFLKGLDLIERERGWPARSAKLVLCLGLGALARHYGLSNVAVGAANRRRQDRKSVV